MGTHARSKQRGGPGRTAPRGLEWIGGRVAAPFYVAEGEPYRPEMTLWIEMPGLSVVSFHLKDPVEPPVSFGASLLDAMKSPLIGRPRRPASVRVADARLAAEVRRVLPDARVVEAPTPEIHDVLELMSNAVAEDMAASGDAGAEDDGSEEPSYFENGRVGIEAVASLFRAADVLYRLAPWKVAADTQVLRVDIPAYDVVGACLSIIGNAGESTGLILFPSLEAFEGVLERVEAEQSHDAPFDMGTTILSLNYDAGSDLPTSMHREALEHGWPVCDARAYPTVEYQDPDGVQRPLAERDVRIVTACASALAAFFTRHRAIFAEDLFDPVCESYVDDDGIEVRITAPCEAADEFAVNEARAADLAADEASAAELAVNEAPGATAGTPPVGFELDSQLVERMSQYARRRFGPGWAAPAAEAFADRSVPHGLLGPWALYHHEIDGKPIIDWFLEEHARELSARERAWMNAQRAAWLSVWEVQAVEPGRTLTLRDLLTDEVRVVQEATASRSLVKRDAVLARVVDHAGTSMLFGVYHRSLSPRDASSVVQRARGRLRRKSSIPIERMQEEAIGRYLIARWEEALADADERVARPPTLVNTDGDPLLLTADHFAFHPVDRAKIRRRLATMKGVEESPGGGADDAVYVFSRPGNRIHSSGETTVIGHVTVAGNALRVETNSINRADAMRASLESSLGPLIRHRAREHSDPRASMKDGHGAPAAPPPPAPASDEMDRVVREFKAKHYADWVDHPLPALDGLTARAAVRTKLGRQQVDLLLKEIEHRESRLPAGQRFDFGAIRRELGLETSGS